MSDIRACTINRRNVHKGIFTGGLPKTRPLATFVEVCVRTYIIKITQQFSSVDVPLIVSFTLKGPQTNTKKTLWPFAKKEKKVGHPCFTILLSYNNGML
jgi:hypothetical protein